MPHYNKVIMIGHLTRDVQLSYTPGGTAVADFGVATNHKWTGQDGSKREEVCFIDCRAFAKVGENLNKFFSKGDAILVEGRLTFDQWEKDGVKRSKHRVTVESFTFVGGNGQKPDEPEAPANRRPGAPIPDEDVPF